MLISNTINLFVEAAPWLLFGYIIAVLLKYALPQAWLVRHLGNNKPSTTIKAALIGAPLPLCSCGVIPAALGLRRAGASKSATTAFLISTPETGVDSIAISYALLGPVMAIYRPIAAVFSAILAGLLVGLSPERSVPVVKAEKSSCCSKSKGCQSSTPSQPTQDLSLKQRCKLYFNTLIELLGDSYRWLLVGLLFAALVQTYVPTDFLQQWGKGFWGMLLMVVIGVPMYICATASTPVAAGLILAGVSPGAALVFMLAGPATNIATLMMVRREFGTTSLLIYLLSLASSAIAFGLGLDALLAYQGWSLGLSAVATQSHQLSIWAQGIAGLLALLMLYTAWQEWQQSRSSI